MKSKKSMIILVLVIFIFGMASVCASDVDDSPVGLSESENMSEITLTDEIQTIGEVDNSQITGAPDDGTFYELDNMIKTSTDNIIKLDKNYTYEESGYNDGIKIEKSDITIDGQGHTIDAKGKTRIFYVPTDNVVIKNITFINGNSSGYAGAVYFLSGGTVTNCNFINNQATCNYGSGAVYFSSTGNVTNCNFIGNNATGEDNRGGAVLLSAGGTVTNCNFTDNHAVDGGAIMFVSTGEVSNCNFTNNSASSRGGAVYFSSTGNVSNCNFTGNTATYTGGAVYFNGNGEVTNCNFADNKATGTNSWGGAIMFVSTGEVSNCNFTGNTATGSNSWGGAIRMNSGTVSNCNFTANTATYDGGAIRFSGSGNVSNCNFADNKATGTDSWGGAIMFVSTGEVSNCNFTANTATQNGGAVYFLDQGTVTNCNFTNNSATVGGGVYLHKNGEVTNCNFIYNKADHDGGAIFFNERSNSNVTFCNFTANYARKGGAVYFSEHLEYNLTFCNFNNNTASENGGAVYFTITSEGYLTFCNFTANNGKEGGAIYTGDCNVENCNFINNIANSTGGAIKTEGGSAINCYFTNNKATGNHSYGGAIEFVDSGTVINCNFTDNSAYFGGAVNFFGGTSIGEIINCNFNNNSATEGGAVNFGNNLEISTATGEFINCNFTDNSAVRGGAVNFGNNLDFNAATGEFINCNFNNNSATDGGAVNFFSMNSFGEFINCNFTDNTAVNGGAVNFLGSNSFGEFINCNFTDNTAVNGGAVFFANFSKGTVTNCNFTNNSATEGGAIVMRSGSVENCQFTGNNATEGSAIFIWDSISVSNSSFLNNKANAAALDVVQNENNIAVTFKGRNNLLNAIYSMGEVTFTNVTYWGAEGIINTGNSSIILSRSENESGQNIAIEIYESDGKLVVNVTLVTDDNGQVKYDCFKLNNGNYKYKVYHQEDCYYTYYNVTGDFNLDLGDLNRLKCYINEADANSVLNLSHNYTFTIGKDENLIEGIVIDKAITINGNGHVIDANGKGRIFKVNSNDVVLENITFINGNTTDYGGAVYFYRPGNVTDCNFTHNSASNYGGAVYFENGGTITNCNFTSNSIDRNNENGAGGAVYFNQGSSSVRDSIFVNNSAVNYGAIHLSSNEGNISGCVFVNNTANKGIVGQAFDSPGDIKINNNIFLNNDVSVNIIDFAATENIDANFNWFGNNATDYAENHDLQFGDVWLFLNATANPNTLNVSDTSDITFKLCAFNSTSNNVSEYDNILLYPVNLTVTAVGGDANPSIINPGKTLTYTANGADTGKITASIENAEYTIEVNVIKANSTLTVDNIEFDYGSEGSGDVSFTGASEVIANVINQPKAVVNVNGKKITVSGLAAGTYTLNVTTVPDENHTAVSQTATITVNKVNSSLTVDDVELDYGESKNVTVTVEGASGVTAKIDNVDVGVVDNLTIPISGLNAGNHTLTVTTTADVNHNSVTKKVSMTVNKASTEIILANETIYLKAGDDVSGVAKLNPGDAGNLTFVSSNNDIALAYEGTIWARIKGNATVTVSFEGNDNYEAAEDRTITVYITPKDTCVSVENDTLYLKVNETYEFDPTVVPNLLAVEYLSGNESVARVTEYGLLRAVGEGTTIITLTVGDDMIYAVNTTNVTVIVSKVPVEITVDTSSLDLKVGDETVVVANLTPADAGNVTFTSSNDSVVEVDAQGNVIAQGKGQAIITVSFAGDNMYAAENKTITVNVSLDDASVTVENDTLDLKIGETCAINATKHPDTIMLDITYTSSDNSVVTVDEKGIVRAVGEGSAIITVEVGDGEIYALNSTNVTVKVSKIPTEITLTNETLDLMYNDVVANLANLTPAGAGNLTFVSDNEDVVVVEKGYIIAVGAGKANLSVSFAGNDKYEAAENKTIKVTVTAWDASVNVAKTSYELFIGESDTIVATTLPEGLKVRFKTDNDDIISVDDNGKITALKKGNAIIYVSVGDNVVYKYDYAIVNVTVNKIPTEIASSAVSALYNADKYLTVNLTDVKGNPIAGVNLTVDLNGAKNYTSDENGQIKVSLKGLDPKTYAAKITFKGDAKYDCSAKDVNVTVKKATPKITANSKIFKTSVKTKKYTITLKDNTGKAIKNAKVSLKVNGKTYKATTNSKGKATFKITKLNKKGSYKATVTYNGNKYYNKISKKANIKVITSFKTVSKGSKDKATVKMIQRALKNNGYYLTEKGHYLMVDGIYWDYTVKAVKQFQKAKGLKVTGKVDEKTAKKLKII